MDLDERLLNLINDLDIYKIDNVRYKLVKDDSFNTDYYSKDLLKMFLNNNMNVRILKIIRNFIDIITTNIPSKYLGNLCNNLQNVRIIKRKFNNNIIQGSSFFAGGYACEDNTIIYYDKKVYKLLGENYNEIINQIFYHELLHLSSCRVVNNNVFCGLAVNNIGDSLNEGYTEYLTSNMFDSKYLVSNYEYEKNIVLLFSNFIGNYDMYECYFNANQNHFIDLLNKYSTYNNTFEIIQKLDFIKEYKLKTDISKSIYDKLISYHFDITSYILDIYTNKLISFINDNLINEDNAINDINTLGLFMFNNIKNIHSLKLEDIDRIRDYIINYLIDMYINKILSKKNLERKF